jgi:antitoxin Phd
MNTSWKLQDAKAKFSQVVDDALKIGPQYVTRRGQEAVVILSVKEFKKITSKKTSLKQFLLDCPEMDDDFKFERQKDSSRRVEF